MTEVLSLLRNILQSGLKRGKLAVFRLNFNLIDSPITSIIHKLPNFRKKPQQTPLRPPKLRHFFFAMPWVIRNEFDRFNRGDSVDVTDKEEVEEVANTSSSNSQMAQSSRLLPDASFIKNCIQRSAQPKRTLWSRLFKRQPRQSIQLPNASSSANSSEFLDFGRKIALIGLHGWFPNRLLHHVIGDPRRTSDRMVEMLESAVLECSDPFPPLIEGPATIHKFPLHGDGTIEERVQKHFDELQRARLEEDSAMNHIYTSDSVIFGAHSQGAPVAVILMAKLIAEGYLNPKRQKISLFCASGIFHGPFPPLRKNLVVQYVEAEAARQLFHLNDPSSQVSQSLLASLDCILQAGVNITCVASWMDQVVPFYSACLLGVEHPNIWRACHVNTPKLEGSEFVADLLQLGLKIKNIRPGLGEPETHMILAQVSDFISGSIYRDAAHSAAYRHVGSFRTALEWMHRGPGTRGVPLKVVDHIRNRPLQPVVNPYYLPWLLRGWLRNRELIEHPLLKEEFSTLPQRYSQWTPTSKLMKEVKFKLEPLILLSKL